MTRFQILLKGVDDVIVDTLSARICCGLGGTSVWLLHSVICTLYSPPEITLELWEVERRIGRSMYGSTFGVARFYLLFRGVE